MHLFLDAAQLIAVLGLAAAIGFAALGVWNIAVQRLLDDASSDGTQDSLIPALRRLVLRRVAAFNERRFPRPYQARISRTLLTAGEPMELRPGEFIGLQQVSLAAFTVLAVLMVGVLNLRLFWAPALMALGWFYPWIWLKDQVTKRHHAMTRALPYNLDLLTLSVEAGLDFAQALGKVVEKGRQGPLADELRLVLRNIKLGKTREEALRTMAERSQLPALMSLVNALVQADRMGTSLGKILRIQSSQLRIERTHRAEKLANEAPVKMLFPLIACIFPTVFMVLFGPIIFQALIGGGQ